ncbi:MAG TPA: ImmA/IrrE family metallo-endopeptidase [Jatrophihabitans sp.]|nr:ImmA/IrrE family metallo-endopeptidase [Jatrophihabitans sp.]
MRASTDSHRSDLRPPGRYDPWRDVRLNWPGVRVVVEPMSGDLLGELRDAGTIIALRAGTSRAQSRCTLAHEIVHLERGVRDCGRWLHREELAVHLTAARRLATTAELVAAIRALGGADDRGALAHALEVDSETLSMRLELLGAEERRAIRRALTRSVPLWSVA